MLQNQTGMSVGDYIIKRRTKSGESGEKSRGADAFRFSCDFRSALTLDASERRIQQGRYLRRVIVHPNRHTRKQVCTYKEGKEDLAKSDAERRSRPLAMPARLNYSPPRAHWQIGGSPLITVTQRSVWCATLLAGHIPPFKINWVSQLNCSPTARKKEGDTRRKTCPNRSKKKNAHWHQIDLFQS